MNIHLQVLIILSFLALDDYKSLYYKAFEKFNKRDYKDAAELFEKAYLLKAHSQIAYYAAYSFYKLDEKDKCIEYAQKSLDGSPTLGDDYVENVNYFLEYWETQSKLEDYEVTMRFSLSKREKVIKNKNEQVNRQLTPEQTSRLLQDMMDIHKGLPYDYDFLASMKRIVKDTSPHLYTQYEINDGYGESNESKSLDFLFPTDSLREFH